MSLTSRPEQFDEEPLAEINVTPFVDVVLVLLIIFMITAAVVEMGLQVEVPRTRTIAAPADPKFQIVQIASDGRLFYDGAPVNLYAIAERARAANAESPTVYVQIHSSAAYDVVAQVLAECATGGVAVNLVPKPLTRDPRG